MVFVLIDLFTGLAVLTTLQCDFLRLWAIMPLGLLYCVICLEFWFYLFYTSHVPVLMPLNPEQIYECLTYFSIQFLHIFYKMLFADNLFFTFPTVSWHILMRMRAPKEGSCDPIPPLELPHSLHAFHRVSEADELNMVRHYMSHYIVCHNLLRKLIQGAIWLVQWKNTFIFLCFGIDVLYASFSNEKYENG